MTTQSMLCLRCPRTRRLLPALVAISLLAALLLASSAAAAEVYGGLGSLGTEIKSGTGGGHGEVNPGGQTHGHAFAVDTRTGDIFIADEVAVTENGKKHTEGRIQEFSAAGSFLAENRIKFKVRKEEEQEVTVERVAGLAVDPSRNHVYLLLAEQRRENKQTVEEQLIKLEKEVAKTEKEKESAENKGETQRVKELKAQLEAEEAEEKKLENEEEALDSEYFSAGDLYSFSTEAEGGELKEKKTVAESALLESASETPRASLLTPTGIAVDPKTGDVIILGQQNEATKPGEEDFRAAAERVHVASKSLGPRYLDAANCLDGDASVAAESHCEEDEAEEPASPIVTTEGRLYAQVGDELWEIPAGSEAGAGFKEVDVTPHFLTELQGESIIKNTISEEEGGALSFVPGKTAGEGTIYMRALFPNAGENGVVKFHYSESGGSATATEEGWTGGQEKNSTQTKCVIPGESNTKPLIAGGTGEQVLMLSYLAGRVMAFGPSSSAEACGAKPTVTPPSLEADNKAHLTEAEVGEKVKLSSDVDHARAIGTKWKLKYKEPGGQTHEEEVSTPYAIQNKTLLEHSFEHEGAYEITETVETDNLAYPTIAAETVKLQVSSIKAALALSEPFVAQQEATIQASVKDLAEAPLHLKAVWNFGDGTSPVEETYEGSTSPLVISVKHAFAGQGAYEVKLEVQDASGAHASVAIPVTVGEGQAEKTARERAEQEAREREAQTQREAAEQAAKQHQAEEAALAAEAAAKKHQEEEAAAAVAKKHLEEEATKKHAEEAAKSKPLTRAQLLAKALKTCKKEPKKKRAKCEVTARKRYAPPKKHSKKK